MATIKEMLTANTADILEATEPLKVLGDRTGAYVWKQLTTEGGDFVAFVTADDEGSYPNKGTQDGYYYVKFDPLTAIAENIREGVSIFDIIGTMSEGLDLSTLGISKFAVDTFTFTSRTGVSGKAISHSLNAVPKLFIIVGESISASPSTSTIYVVSTMAFDYGSFGLPITVDVHYWNPYNTTMLDSYAWKPTVTKTTITLTTGSISGIYFQANKKYTVYTMG